jgi:catechol 2,3-dioxygenase-like lactoylglutathione lyase family enzyme
MRLVHKIDHFLCDVEDYEQPLRFLTEALGLPVAWHRVGDPPPMVDRAGVWLGNADFEVRSPKAGALPPRTPVIGGIAFEAHAPIDAAFVAELDRRGIQGQPWPSAPDGWRLGMNLPGFRRPADEYGFYFWAYPGGRKAQYREILSELEAKRGGVLGVSSVAELVVSTTDWDGTTKHWQTLLDPFTPSGATPGLWLLGDGPAIRLVEGSRDAVARFVINVRSLSTAKAALDELGVAVVHRGDELEVDLEPLAGLDIRLRQR